MNQSKEFMFEHVIERQGYYYMHPDSLQQLQQQPFIKAILCRRHLQFEFVPGMNHYKFTYA